MSSKANTRRYRKRRRAALEAETRARIAAAAADLHETLGPARTTITAIADRAGVQRATVYRHFPDQATLFEACSAHYQARHPMPDPARWMQVADASRRLKVALAEIYGWYAETEDMRERTSRDRSLVPALATVMSRAGLAYAAMRDSLLEGRPERGRRRERTAAAIGHALAFSTWRSLVREQGLDEDDAIALMVALVDAAGRTRPARRALA